MLLSEINRMRMQRAVLAYLKNTPAAVLLIIPMLSNLTLAMELLINAMLAAEQTQGIVAVGAGSGKEAKKLVLLNAAASVGNALLSFANNSNDAVLVTKLETLLKRLDQIADAKFITNCKTIHDIGVANVASLAPFGISNAVLSALDGSISLYTGQEQDVRNKIVQRANATVTIATLQREVQSLLKTQIDKLVNSLPLDQSEYVFEYKRNRLILNLGHKFTQFKGITLNKETQVSLSNVELEFKNAERSVKIKSDNDGKYREVLNPDVYDIIATHPNFEPFVINGIQIQAGEIKIENFEMIPKV